MPTLFDIHGIDLSTDAPAETPEKSGFARRALGDTGISLIKGAIGVPEAIVGVADLATGGRAGKAAESLGFRPKEARAALDEWYSPEQQAANREVQQAQGFVDTAVAAVRNPTTILQSAVESAPSLIPAGVVARGAMAVAPRIGGAFAAGIGEGVISAGQTAEQVRQETADGLLTGEQSAISAASGGLTGVIGGVAGKIANRLGIGDVNQLVAGVQQAGPAAQKSFVRAMMEGFATEGVLQELPQSAQEQIAQNVALGKPWDEGVGNAAAMGALAGGLVGGGVAPFGRRPQAPTAEDSMRKLAEAPDVGSMIAAANELASAPLDAPTPSTAGLDAAQEDRALTAMERQMAADQQAMRFGGPRDSGPASPVPVRGATASPAAEATAQVIDTPPLLDRLETLSEQLRTPEVRETVRAKLGDDALNSVLYYVQQANRPDGADGIPAATRERIVSLAETILSRALLDPVQAPAGQPAIAPQPFGQDALTGTPAAAAPRIGLDTRRTGTVRVDSQGNAVPETRADAISSAQAAQRAQRDETIEPQGRRASAVYGEGLPRRPAPPLNMPERRRTDAVELQPVQPENSDPVLAYVDRLRSVGTPQARAFVQDFNAGRITRRDVIKVMQSQGQDPLTADERLQQAAAQAPAPRAGIQTAQVYRSRTAAAVEARRTGGEVVPVEGGFTVEMPNAGSDATGPGGSGAADVGAGRGAGRVVPVGAVRDPAAAPAPADEQRVAPGNDGPGLNGALTPGERVTLGGKAYTVKTVSPQMVSLDDGAGSTRMVSVAGKTYSQIQREVSNEAAAQTQGAQAPAPAGRTAAAPAADIPDTRGAGDVQAAGVTPVDVAANEAATSPTNDLPEPTEAQKAAGNYKVGRARIAGLDISIENPQGSTRRGVDRDGKAWENTLQHHYGYIKGTEGKDGDHVDVFVKPGTAEDYAGKVYVIDQVDPATGRFDEHKAMIGFASEAEARKAYRANYAKGWTGLKAMTPMSVEQFKAWVRDAENTKRPVAGAPAASPVEAAATHQDPGEAAEPATRAVIRESISTAADAEGRKPSAMKAQLLAMIDAAMADASDEALPAWKEPTKAQLRQAMVDLRLPSMDRAERALRTAYDNRVTEAARRIGYKTFDVPGDGTFKVLNTRDRLAEFRKKVESAQGFKDKPPAAPQSDRVNSNTGNARANVGERYGVESGSGSKAAAFDNMVNEGDLEAASDYAEAVGLDLDPNKLANATKVLKWRAEREQQAQEAEAAAPEGAAPLAANPDALPNPWEISQDEFVRRVTFAKEGSTAFPWVAKWGDRILEAENEEYDHPDLGKTIVQGGRFSKTKREAETIARGAHKRAVRRAALNGETPTAEALKAYPDLQPSQGAKRSESDAPIGADRRDLTAEFLASYETPQEAGSARAALDRTVTWRSGAKGAVGAFILDEYNKGARVVLTASGQAFVHSDMRGWSKRDIGEYGMQFANWLSSQDEAPAIDLKGFDRIPKGNGAFDLRDGNMTVSVEPMGKGRFQASFRGAKSSPHLIGEQGAVDWAANYREEAREQAAASKPTKESARLTDAGEELIRNRRGKLKGLAWDDVSGMNDTLKVAQVVKTNVWPRPDYAKMVEDGAPAWKAAMLKVVYDKVAVAPVTRTTPTDEDLKAYIETVNKVRETLTAELDRVEKLGGAGELWRTLSSANVFDKVFPVPADARSVYGRPSPFDRNSEQGKENNRRALMIGGNAVVQALQFSSRELSKVKDLLADGFPAKQEAWQRSYEVRQTETRDSDVPAAERTGAPQQRFFVYEKGSRWRLAKGGQDGGYATRELAEAFARSLVARKREALPPSRGLDLASATRTGPDWRNGRDVTAGEVMEHFGFRGVNLGEYVKAKQGVAQLHLNHVYDAFNDLADVLGVPPKAMSLNGTLGVAIGAQGSGKALAHFVPGVNEINITRDSGAGALAHEFGHALDHYLATQHGQAASMSKRPYLSAVAESIGNAGGVRPELMAAMRSVMKTINTRPMTEAEAKQYIADQRALNQRRLDRWIEEFKGNRGADKAALDAVAEKLKRGELGDPQDTDVETNLAEMMRAANLTPGNAIGAQAFTIAYRLADLADEARFMASHIPQVPTNYARVSDAMDAKKQSGDGYWSTPWEKFARAFETFAMDALRDRQRESLYLSGLVDSEGWRKWSEETGKSIPFPAGEERLQMQQAFQQLVDAIQTRETDRGVAIFSRRADPERAAQRWTRTDRNAAGPEFYGRDVDLIALREFDLTDEFSDNALPLGHASSVRDGNTAHQFMVVDHDGALLGMASLEVSPAGDIEAIHDIEITEKRTGVGRQVVSAILANASGPVRIIDILDQADAFWQRMGAGYKDTYGNATADWASYQEQGQDARASQGRGSRAGQGLEARRAAEGQPGSSEGSDQEVGPKAERRGLLDLLQGSSGKGFPIKLAKLYADQYGAAGLHRVNVARNIDELPDRLRAKLSGYGDDVRGAYFPGEDQIWVFSDKITSPEELHFVVIHEAFHRGLGRLFGDQARKIMRQMYATNARLRQRADMVAKELGISKDEAIEEALADMAGEGQATKLRGWARLVGMIRQWLRQLTQRMGVSMQFTDAQIETFVAGVARAGLESDEAVADAVPEAAAMASRAASLPRMSGINQQAIRDALADRFKSAGEQVGWWQKTIGTQYDKAKAHPAFGRVFNHVQQYIEDTSTLANEAADKAPAILPKLESVRDVFNAAKRGLSKDDQTAIAAPIFEGTLTWSRQGGELVRFDDLQAQAENMTTEEKARQLLRDGKVSEAELKRWQATPLDIYDGAVRNRYAAAYLQPGVVFTRDELQRLFKLTDAQVQQYEQFRAAVDESLDQVAAADALRLLGDPTPEIRAAAMGDRASFRAAVEAFLTDKAKNEPDEGKRDQITKAWNDIAEKFARVDELKARGYAPLMRFGRYFVGVKGADGEQDFFGLYETRAEANRMARELGADPEFAGRVEQGTMSQEAYKLFSGVPVESLEMFADALGAEQSQVFQEWLRLTKNNRSALKRLIKRKGTAGFSEEVSRVLASFVTSNARMASGAMNLGQAKEAAEAIRAGDLKDEGVKLIEAVQNPVETAGAVRGLMFAHFIGGSIASAVVNTTQPLMMTLPWLSQYGGAAKAAARLMASARMAAGGKIADKEMAAALARAEKDGIVSPQEIHHLTAEAMATWGKNPALKRAAFLWGAPFSVAEQFNRRVTFLAAFKTAKDEGMPDPFAFAEEAVIETQGLYNKGNASNWARNPIGATALTFKQYSVHYLEWIRRMWNAGEPGSKQRADGRRAVLLAMALLMLAGGTEGLPFAEDLNDLADTAMQALGYDASAKGWKREFIARTLGLGDTGADVAMRGLSAVPGIPLDVSMRMGMGNLLPATGMLMKSNTDVSRDVLELAGPFGGLVNQYKDAGRKALDGDIGGAALGMLPVALQNVGKAATMWTSGEARDARGRRVMETDEVDGFMKLIGFQPADIARESAKISEQDRRIKLVRAVESSIADQWAQGLRERDADMVAEAREQLREWNETNPESPISINSAQIKRRVRELTSDKAARFERSAPKELRASVTEALQ